MINKDLSWEISTDVNVGLDLGFLNNRLRAEIDFYNRLRTGMNRPSQMSVHLTGSIQRTSCQYRRSPESRCRIEFDMER